MAGEYKATCGCKIHVAQWTAKRKVVTQESCPLHKNAAQLLAALKGLYPHIHDSAMAGESVFERAWLAAEAAIAKAEGR